jgi:predicted Co/Zn/Cd cation transporter (cation efflux family)
MVNFSIYFWATYMMFGLIFGLIGKNTKLGFWGVFLISIFLTPAIGMLTVLTAKPKKDSKSKFKE